MLLRKGRIHTNRGSNSIIPMKMDTSNSEKVYGSDKEVVYDPEKRGGITISDIGASNAVSLGAYLYALDNI